MYEWGKGIIAKVNIGQGKTGREDQDFLLATLASKKGNDGTGLHGRHSIQGHVIKPFLMCLHPPKGPS